MLSVWSSFDFNPQISLLSSSSSFIVDDRRGVNESHRCGPCGLVNETKRNGSINSSLNSKEKCSSRSGNSSSRVRRANVTTIEIYLKRHASCPSGVTRVGRVRFTLRVNRENGAQVVHDPRSSRVKCTQD